MLLNVRSVCLKTILRFGGKLFDRVGDKFMMPAALDCHGFSPPPLDLKGGFKMKHVPIIELNFIRPTSFEIRIGGRKERVIRPQNFGFSFSAFIDVAGG